ncbi:type II toxin-antitoxin system VapC family toxin [Dongia sp.]|uniref:type II toxin-antitoxin system VapC family toxin n=1 Tax=Dongia sp. TaxID=1977262 RepID=UPI003752713F
MIVVDTSAIMAVLLREAPGEACSKVLDLEEDLQISAGTFAEVLIVAAGRRIARRASDLVEQLGIAIIPATEATARQVGAAYERWGKGFHAASLNFGDCFAYALAKERGCPLLYVGGDFSKTDIKSAI